MKLYSRHVLKKIFSIYLLDKKENQYIVLCYICINIDLTVDEVSIIILSIIAMFLSFECSLVQIIISSNSVQIGQPCQKHHLLCKTQNTAYCWLLG